MPAKLRRYVCSWQENARRLANAELLNLTPKPLNARVCVQMRNEFGDKLESLRNGKLIPAEAPTARPPPVGGGGIGGAFAGGGGVMGSSRMPTNLPSNTTQSVSNQRRPFKNNVFDPLPTPN